MTEKVWGDLECHLDIVQRMALPGLDETLQDAECDIYVLTTVMGLMEDGRWTNAKNRHAGNSFFFVSEMRIYPPLSMKRMGEGY